jgi:hypothetical protein
MSRPNSKGDYDFAAGGDRGQHIYISPRKNLVIVRNDIDFGIPSNDWINLLYQFAAEFWHPTRRSCQKIAAGEQRVALAISWSIVAFLYWRRRSDLPEIKAAPVPEEKAPQSA